MTTFLADQHARRRPWTSDTTWIVIYAITAAVFLLAWAYVPA
jgi:hypothetical protein